MVAAVEGVGTAWSEKKDAMQAAADLVEQFRDLDPVVVLFFASHHHDGAELSRALRVRYPHAEVVGCTTAGEFTERRTGVGAVSAIALSHRKVRRAFAALAHCEHGTAEGVQRATVKLGSGLGKSLRDLDPRTHVGVVLVEGLKMREEDVNEALGNQAPLLSFVGGSAGDDCEFKETRVFCNGEMSRDGAALLVMEMAVPFAVIKTCSFESTGKVFKVTRVDEATRTIYELDGKPVAEAYALATGTTKDKLDGSVFMSHPVGLMIDGKPWIRSPQQLLADGGLRFYCRVSEGMDVHLMRSTDLVEDTRRALAAAPQALNVPAVGGVIFNCILRRLELDAKAQHAPFLATLSGLTAAGFHTYGESYLGHLNQTLTALVFG